MSKSLPSWLSGDENGLRIRLSSPIQINGVLCDHIDLRPPTILDEQAAGKAAGSDEEKREIVLFANLMGCSPGDLTGNGDAQKAIRSRDYRRLQEAYMRFLAEDDALVVETDLPSAGG